MLSSISQSSQWLSLEEASRRSGRSIGHLRRLAAQNWAASGLARQVKRGAKPAWEVHETADPSLARVKFPELIGTDLRQVSEAKRKEALRRKQILDAWGLAKKAKFALGLPEAKITAQFLMTLEAEGTRLSRATLYGWEKRWRRSGLVGLVDARGGNCNSSTGELAGEAQDDRYFEEVKRLYLLPRRLRVSICCEMARLKGEQEGWRIISDRRVRQRLELLDKAIVLKLRFGEEAFVNHAEPYIERDYSTLQSNEIWCADHHQMDVLINVGSKLAPRLARPWLTAWQDLRSRKIVGWMLRAVDPNTEAIVGALRLGIESHGVPSKVCVDNGKDFDSYALNGRTKKDRWLKRRVRFELSPQAGGVFAGLNIEVIHAWPYHGQSKPIERWFGTVEIANSVWPTYCGKDTHSKPHDLQLQIERGNAPLLADYVAWFGDWIESRYHVDVHTGDAMGCSPNEAFAANRHAIKTATAELLDVLCLMPTQPLKVTQNGVTWKGLHYGQYELSSHLGKEVILRVDERDVSRVQVWSIEGKFIAIANANRKLPFNATAEELREAITEKKKLRRLVADAHQVKPRMADDLPDQILRARAARQREDHATGDLPPAAPPTIQPVRSPIEDQLPALRRAIEGGHFKVAAGAEAMSLRDAMKHVVQPPSAESSPSLREIFGKREE